MKIEFTKLNFKLTLRRGGSGVGEQIDQFLPSSHQDTLATKPAHVLYFFPYFFHIFIFISSQDIYQSAQAMRTCRFNKSDQISRLGKLCDEIQHKNWADTRPSMPMLAFFWRTSPGTAAAQRWTKMCVMGEVITVKHEV